jgi:hypothetical protein
MTTKEGIIEKHNETYTNTHSVCSGKSTSSVESEIFGISLSLPKAFRRAEGRRSCAGDKDNNSGRIGGK